jgi:hypothetical protein
MKPFAHLWKPILRHPLTWLAALIVAAGEVWFQRWFRPPLELTVTGLGIGAMLLILWPAMLVRSEGFVELLYRLSEKLRRARLVKLEALEIDLRGIGSEQAIDQLRLLGEKLDTFTEVLKRRLNAGELTFVRYLGTAEQVYLAAIDNLQDVSVALTSVRTIDKEYIESRLTEIRARAPDDSGRREELASLEERRALLDRQHDKVAKLLAKNESAMTALDNTAAVLADTRMARGHASMETEQAMRELEELANRTHKYASVRNN